MGMLKTEVHVLGNWDVSKKFIDRHDFVGCLHGQWP